MNRFVLVAASVGACVLYGVLRSAGMPLSGDRLLDGSLGILLGLYTGSHPAAYAIDLFYLSRSDARPGSEALLSWPNLTLNGLALLCAWMALTLGAIRLGGA